MIHLPSRDCSSYVLALRSVIIQLLPSRELCVISTSVRHLDPVRLPAVTAAQSKANKVRLNHRGVYRVSIFVALLEIIVACRVEIRFLLADSLLPQSHVDTRIRSTPRLVFRSNFDIK